MYFMDPQMVRWSKPGMSRRKDVSRKDVSGLYDPLLAAVLIYLAPVPS
jgi:hypothetical protein